MTFAIFVSPGERSARTVSRLPWIPWIVISVIALVLTIPEAWGQETQAAVSPDPQTTQAMMKRIDELEARLKLVEAALATSRAENAKAEPVAPAQPATVQPAAAQPGNQNVRASSAPTESATGSPMGGMAEGESMDLNKTLLRIRGFGDVNLVGSDLKGSTTSFALGQVNLFITSDLSEKFKFLSEVVFEAGSDNVFGVDIERFLLTYDFKDYLNLAVGRYHTAVGYYNTAYHHSTWLQTATGRPFLFHFEDDGGILPIHNVGAQVFGKIPSGKLGLHYIVEVGNGRASSGPDSEAVQNVIDENNHKAVNVQVFARPEPVPGLQTGVSVYRDLLTPKDAPSVGETIVDGYVVYNGRLFQWLNEGLLLREAPHGTTRTYNIPGFYTQVSRKFKLWTPYFRYQYVNAPLNGPVFYTNVGLQYGPSVGIRYDISDFVAWKLQYDYTSLKNGQSYQTLTLQAGFTF